MTRAGRSSIHSELQWAYTTSDGYAERTKFNAQSSHATIYFQAKDERTPGYELTSDYAETFYGVVLPSDHSSVPWIIDALEGVADQPRLNVAGNRLSKFDWVPQTLVNTWVYNYLEKVAREVRGLTIVSGGQTGADWAGIVAGVKLGLPVYATFPRGFKQETKNGGFRYNTIEQLEQKLHDDLIYMDRLL